MDNIQKILSEISIISKKHDQIDQSTGRCFNIFDITNISDKEVQICRVIAELINPKGRHYQKGKYLKLFCETVLGIIDVTIDNCNRAKIDREKVIDKDRRIDLFIEIADKKIPIETKIGAPDLDGQCKDYFNYAKNSPIYYLTSDGHEPSPDSRVDLTDEQLTCISFETHILQWLGECLKDKETIKLSPIREILLQFEAVVRNLTGQLEEDKAMEIKELLTQSSENMKSAVAIEKNIKYAKIDIMKKLFGEIEIALGKDTCSNFRSYNAKNYELCNDYYKTGKSTLPGINYFWKNTSKKDVVIWLRVQINHRIYVGLYSAKNNEDAGIQLDENDIEKLLGELKPDINDWKVYLEYLPKGGCNIADDNPETPNFKELNPAFFDLFDDNKRKEFIDESVQRIKNLMERANAN